MIFPVHIGAMQTAAAAPVYESSFDASADSFSGVQCIPTGNIDGISGEDNCLRIQGNNATGFVLPYINRDNTFTVMGAYRVKFIYFIPSANTYINQVRAWVGGVSGPSQGGLDAWTAYDEIITGTNGSWLMFRLHILQNGGNPQGDFTGDFVYVKNIVLTAA